MTTTGAEWYWWLACDHPERPPDNRQVFHSSGCRPCRLAAVASGKWLETVAELAERRAEGRG